MALHDALDIAILAEDDDILAVSKPAGLVVHPAYRHPDGTLTDAVFAYADRCDMPRPWLLHRLDRETSGVVLFARKEEARRNLVRQFEQRRIIKRYLAIASGGLATSSGEIDAPLCLDPLDRRRVIVSPAGKPARTRYQVLAVGNGFSLALVEPLTGRTHQIRAHLACLGAPLAGDLTYGGATEATRAAGIERTQLHAWELVFRHPATGASTTIRSPVPADMRAACATLGLDSELLSALSRR
ncbi:MAG TPA: RluA family pseudouridine synthase [Ktedonobacterales bacterium]|nr:RluA family pseudouridine synthase [Ktedonobacterales bacterium]